ncbi:MAG: TRL-like family protein [Bacteroides sp.]|nr:TRL-like family protein [Bacteroides sp.]
MKKALKNLAIVAVAAVTLSSCMAGTFNKAGLGVLYTDVKEGEQVTANARGRKVGTGVSTSILGLITTGDSSIESAANSAGIKRISHVDCEKKNILGIFSTYTIVVYGE